jgi:hypothetical protein
MVQQKKLSWQKDHPFLLLPHQDKVNFRLVDNCLLLGTVFNFKSSSIKDYQLLDEDVLNRGLLQLNPKTTS